MNDNETGIAGARAANSGDDRLDSWKRIAAYLKRDVTTVQRWERREAMPVHRHQHAKQGSVYAYRSELDAWWASRRSRLAGDGDTVGAAPAPNAPSPTRVPTRHSRLIRRVSLAATLLLMIGVIAWYALHAGFFWRNPLAEAKITRLTDFGTERAAAISRDGQWVAFLADRGGQMDAWLTKTGSNRFRNLTEGQFPQLTNPSIRSVGFSPDGSLVSIWTRNADGTRPQDFKLMAAPTSGGPLGLYMPEAAEFDWSADGTRLVFHTTAPGDPLFVRNAGESAAHQIYVAEPGVHCHFPSWSPDGQFIYFIRGEPPLHWDIWRLRPSGGGIERLTFHDAEVSYPVLIDADTLLYLAIDADGSGPWLNVLDVRQRRTHRVSMGLERYTSLAASANGMRLVATVANSHSDLWRVTISDGGPPQSAAIPVTPATQSAAHTPRFGSDYVVYVSSGGGRTEIRKLANGAESDLWHDVSARRIGAPAVAPDGRHIAFSVERTNSTQLYVIDSDGANARVIGDNLALRGELAWTPDSQSLVSAIVRNGEPRLARIFLDGKPPQPMASEYSLNPVWSNDGKYLFYSGADVGTNFPLRALGPDGRPYGMPSLILTRGARRVVFSSNSESLIILRGEIGHKNFVLWNPKTGAERQLTDLPGNFTIGDFDVSPDGQEIIFDRVQETSGIALIERMG
jgi:Tol biopolymer transport system component